MTDENKKLNEIHHSESNKDKTTTTNHNKKTNDEWRLTNKIWPTNAPTQRKTIDYITQTTSHNPPFPTQNWHQRTTDIRWWMIHFGFATNQPNDWRSQTNDTDDLRRLTTDDELSTIDARRSSMWPRRRRRCCGQAVAAAAAAAATGSDGGSGAGGGWLIYAAVLGKITD
jgi:hypothetical protein